MAYIIVENKVAYHFVPKCASRTILTYAYIVKNPDKYDLIKENLYPYKNNYEFLKETTKQWFKRTHRYPINFCVIRDPVDRFLSAFVDRMKRIERWSYMKDYSISKFIETIDDPEYNSEDSYVHHPYKDAKFHMNPLIKFLGEDPSIFTHIFNIKQMNEIKILIEEQSGVKLPELVLNSSANMEKPVLTQSQIEWIKKRYQKDYEIYGKWM